MKTAVLITTFSFILFDSYLAFKMNVWTTDDNWNVDNLKVQVRETVDDRKAHDRETYIPAKIEKYILENLVKLRYNVILNPRFTAACQIWHIKELEIHDDLMKFRLDLKNHTKAIKNFKPIPDLLNSIISNGSHDVCRTASLHPQGLKGLFPGDQTLSKTSSGYVEPLVSPMRSPEMCFADVRMDEMTNQDYLVHDFESMCRKLKPHSRRVFIDVGASLTIMNTSQPVFELLDLYEKFGFKFDHIYAFESTFVQPEEVYKKLLPKKYFDNYHWINVGKK